MTGGHPFYIGLFFLLVPYDIFLFYVFFAYVKTLETIISNNIQTFVTMKNIIVFIVIVLADCEIGYIVCYFASRLIHRLKNASIGIIQNLCTVKFFGKRVGCYKHHVRIQIDEICGIAF